MDKILIFLRSHIVFLIALILVSGFVGGALELRKSLFVGSELTPKTFPPEIISNISPTSESTSSSQVTDSLTITPDSNNTLTPTTDAVLGDSTDNSAVAQDTLPPIPTSPPAPVTFGIDITHSSLSANSVPADNSSKATVNVTLENSSGGPLGGLNVALSTGDGAVNFYPSSASTNSSGHVSFTASSYSSTAEAVNATIKSGGQTYTIPALGTITFQSLGTSSSSSSSVANSNCTSAAGVPNSWYSDVYPNSPTDRSPAQFNVNTGSTVIFSVVIRDCNENPVTQTEKLSFSSGDSNLSISPQVAYTSNGVASFSVSSQNPVTDTITVQDDTSSFTVTDINNSNPTVTFTAASATPLPTSAPTSTPTPSTATPTPISSATGTPTLTPSPTI